MVARALALVGLLGVLVAGCATGERPRLADDPFAPRTPTGNAELDSLLPLLDQAPAGPVTVKYDVLRKADPKTTAATVVVRGSDISVTIGEVRYLTVGGNRRTCAQGVCTDTWQAQRVSDTGVTPQFYNDQVARKVRRFAPALIGPVTATTEMFGGAAAQCRAMPMSGTTSTYCAFDFGLVASADDGDVRITATEVVTAADDAAFSNQ